MKNYQGRRLEASFNHECALAFIREMEAEKKLLENVVAAARVVYNDPPGWDYDPSFCKEMVDLGVALADLDALEAEYHG